MCEGVACWGMGVACWGMGVCEEASLLFTHG